jgi:hypothetical protein
MFLSGGDGWFAAPAVFAADLTLPNACAAKGSIGKHPNREEIYARTRYQGPMSLLSKNLTET